MESNVIIELVIALLGGGALGSIIVTLLNKRNTDRTSLVNDVSKIQEVYEKTLNDLTLRTDKRILELEKIITLKDALLEQSRQTQGELLVKIDDMKKTVTQVGDDVNFITGDLRKHPLVNDSQAYGRRATDKP